MNLDGDDNMCLMGIVTGASMGDNVGTLLTPQLMQWVISKLTDGSDYAGRDTSTQQGNTGSGSRNWKPPQPRAPSGGDWTMADFSGFQVKKCNGNTTIIGMTNDGRQVELSTD